MTDILASSTVSNSGWVWPKFCRIAHWMTRPDPEHTAQVICGGAFPVVVMNPRWRTGLSVENQCARCRKLLETLSS